MSRKVKKQANYCLFFQGKKKLYEKRNKREKIIGSRGRKDGNVK